MAEERISIHICSNKCRCLREIKEGYSIVNGLSKGTYCSAYIHGTWQKIDPEKDCKDCTRAEYEGMSRTEAIKRMAKAMCKEDTGVEWEDMGFVSQHTYKDLAEFALDGLLEAYRNE